MTIPSYIVCKIEPGKTVFWGEIHIHLHPIGQLALAKIVADLSPEIGYYTFLSSPNWFLGDIKSALWVLAEGDETGWMAYESREHIDVPSKACAHNAYSNVHCYEVIS